MTVPYQFKQLKPNHEMPSYPECTWLKEAPEYHLSQANIKPVEATPIELGYEIERLENEVLFEKANLLHAQQANKKLSDDIREWEVKYKNSEFANKNLQAKLDKLEGTEQYSLWLMQQYLNVKKELASVEDKGMGRSEWI